MANAHWTIESLPWDKLEPAKASPVMLKLAKAAALVEYNGHIYADYLCNVFQEDQEFCDIIRHWAAEEVQHGQALGTWAARVDPGWDFDAAVQRFRDGYKIDIDAMDSKRGSRAGELVSRCIVETGTSNYYTALSEASEEPVFRQLCRHIAADELRHYKLFYSHLGRYLKQDRLNRFKRFLVSLSRIQELDDDELPYAFYAANYTGEPYDRVQVAVDYIGMAYSFYRPHHVDRMVGMVFKASGLKPHTWLHGLAARYAYRRMHSKATVELPAAA